MVDVALNSHGAEALGRLLRLLPPAPDGWVATAKRILLDLSVRDQRAADERGISDGDLTVLGRKLEVDPEFRKRFDIDPVAAVEAAGMHELALALERELAELVALAERIANDDVYRAKLNTDPVAALEAADLPAATVDPLLQALAVPDHVLAKLPEVVAHQGTPLPPKARLLLLLLGSTAVTARIRAATRGG